MTNIYKLTSTLLREFEFELNDDQELADIEEGVARGKIPELVSVGISDLAEPLMVRARKRSKKGDS